MATRVVIGFVEIDEVEDVLDTHTGRYMMFEPER